MRKILVASTLLVAGCAAQALQQRQGELSQLIGRSETDLVRSVGVPTRTYDAGGVKYLAYNRERYDYDPGFYGPGFGYGRFGYGGFGGFYGHAFYGGAFGWDSYAESCETTFQVAGGVVRSYTLRGNDCAYLAATAQTLPPVAVGSAAGPGAVPGPATGAPAGYGPATY